MGTLFSWGGGTVLERAFALTSASTSRWPQSQFSCFQDQIECINLNLKTHTNAGLQLQILRKIFIFSLEVQIKTHTFFLFP